MPIISSCDDATEWNAVAMPDSVPIPVTTSSDAVSAPASIQASVDAGYFWLYVYKDITAEDWTAYPILQLHTKASSLTNRLAITILSLKNGSWVESTYDLIGFTPETWQTWQIDLRTPSSGETPNLTHILRVRLDISCLENPVTILLDHVETMIAEEPPPTPINWTIILGIAAAITIIAAGLYLATRR